MKNAFVVFIIGYLFGCLAMYPAVQHAKRDRAEASEWQERWYGTRDAWLKDRREWRDGKAFAYNYGPHGSRW